MTIEEKTPRDEEVEALTAALVFGLLTGGDSPYPIPPVEVRKIADLLHDCGVRQTDQKADEIELPGWVAEQLREQAEPVPVEPDHTAIQETQRVREAPVCPSKVPKALLGRIESA